MYYSVNVLSVFLYLGNGIQSHKDLQYLQESDYERMDFMDYEKLRLKEFISTSSGKEHFHE